MEWKRGEGERERGGRIVGEMGSHPGGAMSVKMYVWSMNICTLGKPGTDYLFLFG